MEGNGTVPKKEKQLLWDFKTSKQICHLIHTSVIKEFRLKCIALTADVGLSTVVAGKSDETGLRV